MIQTLVKNKRVMTAMTACALMVAPVSGAFAGDQEAENRDLPTFHSIVVKGAIELEVKIGGKQKVNVSVEDMKLSSVTTEVKDGVLYIDTLKEKSFWGGKRQHGEVELTLTMSDFKGIKVKGAVDGDIVGINSKTVDIEVSGAADLNLTGTCETLNVNVRGAGDLDAEDLKCKDVDVSISGAGDADVYASEKVKAVVSGVGNVNILGKPKDVIKTVRGLGDIKVRM